MHQYLDLPYSICPLSAKSVFDEVNMVETDRKIKGPYLEFSEFLRLIGIWILMTENPGTNWTEYFSENPMDIFSG